MPTLPALDPTQIKLITFDLDDTLWDGHKVILHAEQAMLDWMANHTPMVMETYNQDSLRQEKMRFAKQNKSILHKVSTVRLEFLKFLFNDLKINNSEKKALECYNAFFQARQNIQLFDGMEKSLSHLNKHFRVAAITNGNSDLNIMGLHHFFEFCLSAEDFPAAKPEPHMFEAALEKTGLSAAQCLHVGDHPNHDMLGAYNAGWRTCWLKDGKREWKQDFEADLVIESVNELPDLLLG